MSKDFEKSYRELAKSEAPDLWDRIESGLSRQSTRGQAEEEKRTETAPKEKKRRSGKILHGIYRYSPMAAAVICAIIIIPIFINGDKPAPSLKAEMEEIAESEAAEMAAVPQEEGIAQTDADAGAEQESAVEESGAQDSAAAGSAVQDSVVEESTLRDHSAAGGAVQESAMEESSDEDSAVEKRAESKKAENALQNTALDPEGFFRVVVEVTGSKDVAAQENAQEAGTVYTALVERDPEGILAKGEEIAIFIPVYSSVSLAVGEAFELDLTYWEVDEDLFTVCGFYGQAEK